MFGIEHRVYKLARRRRQQQQQAAPYSTNTYIYIYIHTLIQLILHTHWQLTYIGPTSQPTNCVSSGGSGAHAQMIYDFCQALSLSLFCFCSLTLACFFSLSPVAAFNSSFEIHSHSVAMRRLASQPASKWLLLLPLMHLAAKFSTLSCSKHYNHHHHHHHSAYLHHSGRDMKL